MYLILWQLSMAHWGTSCSRMASSHSGLRPRPLRTLSMMSKLIFSCMPLEIRKFMMSSRVQKHWASLAVPELMMSCALPSHTSVPCERPEMRMSSSMVVGRVSMSMPRTKLVPNSGMPSVPVSHMICSWVTPSASGLENRLMTFRSSSGISRKLTPVSSSSRCIMVGSSCPRQSSLTRMSCMELKS